MQSDDLEAARLRIYAIEDGAIRAQALAFCLETGFFDALEERAMSSDEISRRFRLAPRVLPALLAFLSSQELIVRTADGRWSNTAASSEFLVRKSGTYVGGRGLLFAGFHEAIGHLGESLASGDPWTPAGQHDMFAGFGPEQQHWFGEGMFSNAVHGAQALLRELDLSGYRNLLDVGGNAGGYSITLLRALPELRATIFDLPAVEPLAHQRVVEAGLEHRIRFVGGSFFDQGGLPHRHDVVLLASILHDWDEDDCRVILTGCFAALEPGGRIIVTEPMLSEDLTGPEHPSVSGLTMAVLGGENRTQSAIGAMLKSVGFIDPWFSRVGAQNSTVCAWKPAFESATGARTPNLDGLHR